MKKRKIYMDGYLTVEASFLVPMAFILLWVVIYWGIFFYDTSVSVQCGYISALRGSNQWQLSYDGQREYAHGQLESLIEETLLFMDPEKVELYENISLRLEPVTFLRRYRIFGEK